MNSSSNTINVVNAALKLPITGLKPCKRVPKSATLAVYTSSGVAVWFTDSVTYVTDDAGTYIAIYDADIEAAMSMDDDFGFDFE